MPLRSQRYLDRPPNNRPNSEDDSDSLLFSLVVAACSPWLLLLLATGGEFVSESLDLRFESVDALGFLRECRLEFVDAVAQDLVLLSARYARLRSESAAPMSMSGDDVAEISSAVSSPASGS